MSKNIICIDTLAEDFLKFLNNDVLLGALDDKDVDYGVCFDCNLWNNGFICKSEGLDPPTTIIPPISSTFILLLEDMECFLKGQLCDFSCTDFGYKSQIERLLSLVIDLKNKVLAIKCVDPCNDQNILSVLLATLIQTILLLIAILEYINGLLTYTGNCGCVSVKLTEILMGKLINGITELQCLLQDWYGIVVTFLYYSSTATKPYIASYVPKQPIPVPQPHPQMSFACVPCPPQPPPRPAHQPQNCTPFNCK